VLTSLTTAVGFLTLNFSVAPNFRVLGNISAFGVIFAMLISLTLMPVLVVSMVRKSRLGDEKASFVYKVADFVVAKKRGVFWGSIVTAVLMIALIPLNVVDDDPIKYFKDGVPYRDAAVFAQDNLPGIKNIGFSVECGEADCVNDPEFLKMLEAFDQWLMEQEGVEYVMNYVDVIKRLNRNMHGDDPAWYRLPDSRELAAQYQLLYELSLPYGLDLNNQLNFDKSATRVEVWLRQVTTSEFLAIQERAGAWLKANNNGISAHGSSVHMMFASMGERNIASMIIGAIAALIGVTITIIVAMGSFKYGLLSMIPNAFPAAMAFGLWGLLVGEVNLAVASVFSITLGIVVDNTVHFISKYRRAKDRGSDTEASVRYSFTTVGKALLITTGVLAIGFAVLTLSRFNLNAYMGGLTSITVVVALIFDFLMLPALLLLIDKGRVATIDDVKQVSQEEPLTDS
ncbi:MAG: efflux RND transporter permease subunit, partial [Spongiibacteraceae bacterium]